MFKSGLIFKDKCYVPNHDSYSSMREELNLSIINESSIKAALIPPNGDYWNDIDEWVFRVFEENLPDWYLSNQLKYEKSFRKAVKDWAKNHIFVGKEFSKLSGGTYYLKKCKVKKVKGYTHLWLKDSMIMELCECSIVDQMLGESVIQKMSMDARVIQMSDNSFIQNMCDFSRVQNIRGNAMIQHMMGSSFVYFASEDAIIQSMECNAIVNTLRQNATIQTMRDTATVFKVFGKSMIQGMYGASVVQSMSGRTLVQSMYDYSTVQNLCGTAKVAFMKDEARVIVRRDRVVKAPQGIK